MSRRFTLVTVGLNAVVAFLVGAIVAGGFLRPAAGAQGLGASRGSAPTAATVSSPRAAFPPLVNFADVVERVNPAVVNISATSDSPGGLHGGAPRRGSGSGFIIDADGSTSDEALIHEISARAPGTTSELRLLRDGREITIAVKLAERPSRDPSARRRERPAPSSDSLPPEPGGLMGLAVRDLDAAAFNRLRLPRETRGVLITRVDPLSDIRYAQIPNPGDRRRGRHP